MGVVGRGCIGGFAVAATGVSEGCVDASWWWQRYICTYGADASVSPPRLPKKKKDLLMHEDGVHTFF